MNKKRLFQYLSKLSLHEWDEFNAYLESPILGSSRLYQNFLKTFREIRFDAREFTEEAFYQKAHPKGTFDRADLNRHLSMMQTKLFDFIAWKEYQSEQQNRHALLVRSLARRGWKDAFDRELAKPLKRNFEINNSSSLLNQSVLELLKIDLGLHRFENEQLPEFQSAIYALDEGYLLTALDLACKASNRDLFPTSKHSLPRYLPSNLSIDDPYLRSHPLATVLVAILSLYQATDEQECHYQSAKHVLFDSIKYLSAANQRMFEDLFTLLANYAVRRFQLGHESFRTEIGEIYTFMLANQVLMQEGQMSVLNYQNVATIFFRIKDLAGAEKFLKEYQPHLPEPNCDPTFQLHMALLHFHRSEFHEARRLFYDAESRFPMREDFEFQLRLKTYQVVVEIECHDFGRAEERATYFVRWLKPALFMAPERKVTYLKFARYTKRLATLIQDWQAEKQLKRYQELLRDLDNATEVAPVLKDWLMAKLAQLKNDALPS